MAAESRDPRRVVQRAPLVREPAEVEGSEYVAALPHGPIVLLDEVGVRMLEALAESPGSTAGEVLRDLAQRLGWPEDEVAAAGSAFVDRLVEAGILEPTAPTAQPSAPAGPDGSTS